MIHSIDCVLNTILQIKVVLLSRCIAQWSNTLKQFIGFYRRIVSSVFDHFVTMEPRNK